MVLEYKHKTKPYSGKQEEQIHNYTLHTPSCLKKGQILLKNVPNLHIIFVLPVCCNSANVNIDGRLTKYFSEYFFLSSTMKVFLHQTKQVILPLGNSHHVDAPPISQSKYPLNSQCRSHDDIYSGVHNATCSFNFCSTTNFSYLIQSHLWVHQMFESQSVVIRTFQSHTSEISLYPDSFRVKGTLFNNVTNDCTQFRSQRAIKNKRAGMEINFPNSKHLGEINEASVCCFKFQNTCISHYTAEMLCLCCAKIVDFGVAHTNSLSNCHRLRGHQNTTEPSLMFS